MKGNRQSGMTLIEMLTAVTVLMILTAILAQVFFQATRATAKGKGLVEIYQVARAIEAVFAKDISGATPRCFVGGENGLAIAPIADLPPGPYNLAQHGTGLTNDELERMLMGGSDYLAFTTSNSHSGGNVVFYVLRANGDLIRLLGPTLQDLSEAADDSPYWYMNYRNALGLFTPLDHRGMKEAERNYVMAQNIERLKFSYLDRGSAGPLSSSGGRSAQGVWIDSWDWTTRRYLPGAVKVQLQIVDHLWKISDEDALSNRTFDATKMDKADASGNPLQLEAAEMFDPNDGEAFTFIIDLPLAMKTGEAH